MLPTRSMPAPAASPVTTPAPPSDAQMAQLLSVARAARALAYAPYSHFAVGAALLDELGRVHAGCNIENAAYPQGQCAEASAIAHLVLAGGRRIVAAVVVGVAEPPTGADADVGDGAGGDVGGDVGGDSADATLAVTPCGGCRQRLREFAADDTPVWSADMHRVRARFTLGFLLPASFGPAHLATRPVQRTSP